MIVTVTGPPGSAVVALRDPADFHELKVTIDPELSLAEGRHALSRVAEFRDGYVWFPTTALEHLAGVGLSPEWDCALWEDGFRRMLRFAAEHGWVDEASQAVAAHCEVDGVRVVLPSSNQCDEGGQS